MTDHKNFIIRTLYRIGHFKHDMAAAMSYLIRSRVPRIYRAAMTLSLLIIGGVGFESYTNLTRLAAALGVPFPASLFIAIEAVLLLCLLVISAQPEDKILLSWCHNVLWLTVALTVIFNALGVENPSLANWASMTVHGLLPLASLFAFEVFARLIAETAAMPKVDMPAPELAAEDIEHAPETAPIEPDIGDWTEDIKADMAEVDMSPVIEIKPEDMADNKAARNEKILDMLNDGISQKDIAAAMNISPRQVGRIKAKLNGRVKA